MCSPASTRAATRRRSTRRWRRRRRTRRCWPMPGSTCSATPPWRGTRASRSSSRTPSALGWRAVRGAGRRRPGRDRRARTQLSFTTHPLADQRTRRAAAGGPGQPRPGGRCDRHRHRLPVAADRGLVFTLPQQELGRVQEAMARGPCRCRWSRRHPGVQRKPPPGAAPRRAADHRQRGRCPRPARSSSRPPSAMRTCGFGPVAFVNVRLEVDRAAGVTTVPLVACSAGRRRLRLRR